MNRLLTILTPLLALTLLLSTAVRADERLYSQAQLNQLLAPVALYPDTVLSHLLIASTYPLEVVQAERWASRNTHLEGQEAVEAVSNRDWDPSVQALVAFPHILERMADDLDWTQQVGDAFLHSESTVLATVQDLRQRAYESGNLKTTEHQEVVVENRTIIVESRQPEVVYIPYYDTRVVYGPWYWSAYPPVVWHYPSHGYYTHSSFYWSPGVRISTGFYFSSFHWSNRHVVVIDRRHSGPRFSSARAVVRYQNSKRWHHNPTHRRGVDYRHREVRQRYATPSRQARPANRSSGAVSRAVDTSVSRAVDTSGSRAANTRRPQSGSVRSTRNHREQQGTTRAHRVEQNLRSGAPSRLEQRSGGNRANYPAAGRTQNRQPETSPQRQERTRSSAVRRATSRASDAGDDSGGSITRSTREPSSARPPQSDRGQNHRARSTNSPRGGAVQRSTRERVDGARANARSTSDRGGRRTTTRDR